VTAKDFFATKSTKGHEKIGILWLEKGIAINSREQGSAMKSIIIRPKFALQCLTT